MTLNRRPLRALGLTFALVAAATASAQLNPPVLSSRSGAAYTVFLDFSGFSYTGTWSDNGSPGTTPAYDIDGDPTTFSAQEVANMKTIYASVASK